MKCTHRSVTKIHFNITASYEKRKGGQPYSTTGDYGKCDNCKTGIFIPYPAHLNEVPCQIEFTVSE